MLQDVVDWKESHPREFWLDTLAWRILFHGNDDPATARVDSEREFVRERCIAHVRTVRPGLTLLHQLSEKKEWEQLSEAVIQQLDLGRCSFTEYDWRKLIAKYDGSINAPFLTRIPASCFSEFQLAPNVKSIAADAEEVAAAAAALMAAGGDKTDTAAAASASAFSADSAAAADTPAAATARAAAAASASVGATRPRRVNWTQGEKEALVKVIKRVRGADCIRVTSTTVDDIIDAHDFPVKNAYRSNVLHDRKNVANICNGVLK